MKMRLDGTCLECGDPLARHAGDTRRSDTSFCCIACRKTFNNRRAMRGAELYDLYMAHRFDRRVATDLGVMQAINRLASVYRQEDQRSRDGRRSWRKPKAVLQERPYLKAISTSYRAGR